MGFPEVRLRRLRRTDAIRRLTQDIQLSISDLVYPLFLDERLPAKGGMREREITSMPGVHVYNETGALAVSEKVVSRGIPAVILFGVPSEKDSLGTRGDRDDAIVPVVARALKDRFGGQLVVFADLCLCEYTDHGHCGILDSEGNVDNDKTLGRLEQYAVVYAQSGIDFVSPSGMMDGMVVHIRRALDSAGYSNTGILSYAVKYASAYYGPFRDAVESAPQFGDRKAYQMPNHRRWEAFREAGLDIDEGADILMVKPAIAYLDIIRDLSMRFPAPVFAYQVSGEYAMIKYGAQRGLFDYQDMMKENLISIKRAGATSIITYAALDLDGL